MIFAGVSHSPVGENRNAAFLCPLRRILPNRMEISRRKNPALSVPAQCKNNALFTAPNALPKHAPELAVQIKLCYNFIVAIENMLNENMQFKYNVLYISNR